jgi:hypothetical protein
MPEIDADVIKPVKLNFRYPVVAGTSILADFHIESSTGQLDLLNSRWLLGIRKRDETENVIERDTELDDDFTVDSSADIARLTLDGSATASLEAGEHDLQVLASVDGKEYLVAFGTFRVRAAFVSFGDT